MRRWLRCFLRGHEWVQGFIVLRTHTQWFIRCERCGKTHNCRHDSNAEGSGA